MWMRPFDRLFEVDVSVDAVNVTVHAAKPAKLLESLQRAGRVEKLRFLRVALRLLLRTFRGKYRFQRFHGHCAEQM